MDFSQELHIEMSQWMLYRCFGFHKFHSGKSIHFILYTFNRAIIQLPKLNGFLNWSSSFMVTCSYRSYYHIIWATYYFSQIWNSAFFGGFPYQTTFGVTNWRFGRFNLPRILFPKDPCMVHLPTFGWYIYIYTIWLNNRIIILYIYICINQM